MRRSRLPNPIVNNLVGSVRGALTLLDSGPFPLYIHCAKLGSCRNNQSKPICKRGRDLPISPGS
jgi:hypothetical protein